MSVRIPRRGWSETLAKAATTCRREHDIKRTHTHTQTHTHTHTHTHAHTHGHAWLDLAHLLARALFSRFSAFSWVCYNNIHIVLLREKATKYSTVCLNAHVTYAAASWLATAAIPQLALSLILEYWNSVDFECNDARK